MSRISRESDATFAGDQGAFGEPAFRQIREQPKDKNRLNKTERDPGYDPTPVIIPNRRFAEQDHATGWQTFLVDFPALQLPPVITGRQGAHNLGRETRGWFAMQNANCDMGRFDSFKLGLIEPAADNSQAELMLKYAVDRRIRDRMNPLQCLVRIVRHSRGIAQKQDKKKVGIRRQSFDLLQHLIQ